MNADEVTRLIQAGLPDAEIRVLTDDDTHFEAVVVAAEFEGRRSLQRHQLVYAALGPLHGAGDPRPFHPGLHAGRVAGRAPRAWPDLTGAEARGQATDPGRRTPRR